MNAPVRLVKENAADDACVYQHISALRDGLYLRHGKRATDLVLLFLTLPVSATIIAICAFCLVCAGQRPFYSQNRVGRGGRVFRLWKLRTMLPDASERLEELLRQSPDLAQEWRSAQKLQRDPRVTRIGRFLRKTSLDELPQLWNVLRGDMSLVGPRPFLPSQSILYPGRAYYELLPGLTGLWQISTRHTAEFSMRAAFDTQYAHKLSLRLDLLVMLRSLGVVFRGTGI